MEHYSDADAYEIICGSEGPEGISEADIMECARTHEESGDPCSEELIEAAIRYAQQANEEANNG